MASSPVTAPSPKAQPSSPPPPSSSSPPPKDSPPPPQSQPPPDEATSPPPSISPPPSPPLSPPPAASSPPPPTTASPSPPSTTLPPPQPTPPPPTTSPAPPIPINNSPPQSPQPGVPPAPQTAALSPPIPGSNNVIPPPSPPYSKPTPSGELPHPHAPTHRAPATPSNQDNSRPSQDVDKIPLIVGITAGVGILFLAMVVIFVLCTKKKKRKSVDQMQYYGNPPHGSKAAGYYDNAMQQQQQMWYNNNNPQMKPGSLKVPPPPGLMGPAGGGWPPHHQLSPSNPNHNSSSSEMSSDPHHSVMVPPSPNGTLGMNKSTFSYDELAIATNGFSQANLLGQGGFGYVHKGVLPNGKVVAVKCLKAGSGQGEREFQAEVEIISRVHHRHLVSLVGYCMAGDQRILVYEFVPNKTLEFHLHGKDCPPMEWQKRLTIALGAAKGLAYLHEDCHPRIIHRDIKAANILIDNNFEAMVADFGLAKLSQDNITHVSTRVMGTFGYLAPEYASSGKLTEKSDVFSFGVMLLELITGRRPVDTSNSYMDDSLVDWARPIMARGLSSGEFGELVDTRLENHYNEHEMERMIACAAASIRHSSRRRPKMSQIVRALEGDVSLEALNEGVQPGQSTAFNSSGADYDKSSYNADLKKFRKMALGSQEAGSSELSGAATSTYGLNPSDSSTDDSSTSGEVSQAGSTKRPNY